MASGMLAAGMRAEAVKGLRGAPCLSHDEKNKGKRLEPKPSLHPPGSPPCSPGIRGNPGAVG